MSGSVSPLPWTGNKGCIYTTIDAFMPPHRTYVEACMGSAEVFLRKKPLEKEIINDYNGDLVRFFRVLQRNENLERLIGRLFLSFNSEQIFRANKALLAEVPNILDDLTETSVIMEEIIQHFSRTDDYETACGYLLEKALPEYPEEMNRCFSLQALRQQQNLSGHIGQIEYAAKTENGIGWYEVNAFMGVDEEGTPIANIFGRERKTNQICNLEKCVIRSLHYGNQAQ